MLVLKFPIKREIQLDDITNVSDHDILIVEHGYDTAREDQEFWAGCRSCVNFDILQLKEFQNCMCTAMLYDPSKEEKKVRIKTTGFKEKVPLKENLVLRIMW